MGKQKPQHLVSYFHWSVRLAVSLLIAWYLNTPTQYKSFLTLLYQRNYQEAVIFSFLTALLVISGVHYTVRFLDRYITWEEKTLLRFTVQLLVGVIAMIYLTYISVKIYFNFVQGDIELSDYLVVEFPIVEICIVMLNVIYLCYYVLVKYLMPKSTNQYLQGKLGGKLFFIRVTDILCLIREGKDGYAILKKGKKIYITYTMAELEALLDARQFFRANRSLMVSLDMVMGYKPVKNMQCLLILKIPVPEGVDLLVARNRAEHLKKLLKKDTLEPRQKTGAFWLK